MSFFRLIQSPEDSFSPAVTQISSGKTIPGMKHDSSAMFRGPLSNLFPDLRFFRIMIQKKQKVPPRIPEAASEESLFVFGTFWKILLFFQSDFHRPVDGMHRCIGDSGIDP